MANPTLTDIDNPDFKPGDGTTKPDDLAAQQIAQAAAAEEAQAAADATRLAELQTKPLVDLTPEETAELNKLKGTTSPADPSADDDLPADDEGDENPLQFWDDVDKLHGEALDIKWEDHKDPEGNPIDPLSPEGVLIRDKAIEARAVAKFEQHLAGNDARAYAYMLHRQSGGTDEDFFSAKTITLPEYTEFSNSVDLQQKLYREDLVRKGVSEKQAQFLVDQAVKDKEIFELADKAYKAQEKEEANKLIQIQTKLEADEKEFQNSVKALTTMLSAEINTSATMKFLVPEAKKTEFYQYVSSRVQESAGKFLIVQEIEKNSLPRLLEGLYLQFVNGNLKDVVERQAKTSNVRTLRDRLNRQQQKRPDSAPPGDGKKTLGDL